MRPSHLLIMFHCEQNTGYAIGSLEKVFEAAALAAGFAHEQIVWSYSRVHSPALRTFQVGYFGNDDAKKLAMIHAEYPIKTVLAFDMPYPTKIGRTAHQLGISNIISYWGASMSSVNSGMKLLAKKLEWYLRRSAAPTFFVFESEAMRQTAVRGRGVPDEKTHVIPLGVDTDAYTPDPGSQYAHRKLGIPPNRKIIFFSGHMEERKGVRVLINAMNRLNQLGAIDAFHLLICGNRGDESAPYEALIDGQETRDHVTFAGYRHDIARLMQSSYLGVIASTGWDSFTMSSVEMMASGLPLIVSDLQGLRETTEPNRTGFYINPGDSEALAQTILYYADNDRLYRQHSMQARERALANFSVRLQIDRLSRVLASGGNN